MVAMKHEADNTIRIIFGIAIVCLVIWFSGEYIEVVAPFVMGAIVGWFAHAELAG